MTDSKDELRQRFDQARNTENTDTTEDTENTQSTGNTESTTPTHETEDTPDTDPRKDPSNTSGTDDTGDTGNTEAAESAAGKYDWSDKYNYPFYVPPAFADELDQLYNQYDGKNKIEGGDGLEKHREFLFPIMRTALEKLDLDEVVDWQPEE